ncbi:MAG: phosphoenolpyruvate carboxykinase (ATP) [Chloroflexota bacterium]|nr:phosphoenolpyruvate carboxykinase (ATP) [Chloroflexota bacterium]
MSTFNIDMFSQTAQSIRRKAQKEKRIMINPSSDELRALTAKEPGVRKTKYDNFVAESEPTSRAQVFTKNNQDHKFGEAERRLLIQCKNALAQDRLLSIDRVVGSSNSGTTVRLTIPERFAHVAYGGGNLFGYTTGVVEQPTYEIIMFSDDAFEANKTRPLPEKDITIRIAMLDDGRVVKIVRNGNYIGEYKKGVFAAEDWITKSRRNGIFLHAGCREDHLESAHGDYRTQRTLLIALSANGKTTTTSKILARKGMEKSWLIQDDGGALMPDGSFHGFESRGIFVKTENVNPGEQTEIFYGLLKPETVCENVYVDEDDDFDFCNFEITSNGRAVVLRRDFMHTSPYIDVEHIDNVILISRGPLIPAICKLTMKQAAALMVLGQAMESSAGDPTQAGKIRSEFFYDPFVAGNHADHANRFYDICRGLPHLNYYLINTGGVGEGERFRDIRLEATLGVLDSLLRGGLEDWVDSPTEFKVPKAIRSVDDIFLRPEKLYSKAEFSEKQHQLNRLRCETIEKVGEGLHPDIRNVFSC